MAEDGDDDDDDDDDGIGNVLVNTHMLNQK